MHCLYTADIYRPGTIFLPLRPTVRVIWVDNSLLQSQPRKKAVYNKVVRYGLSRSFTVIEIGTNGKPVCDFLLVLHCNYVSVLVSET